MPTDAPEIKKQLIAVIDSRTTVICLHAAGQIRKITEPFQTLNGDFDNPPFHVHCRSLVMPWLPGFVNDIRKEANAEVMRRPLKQRRMADGRVPNRIPGPDSEDLKVQRKVAIEEAKKVPRGVVSRGQVPPNKEWRKEVQQYWGGNYGPKAIDPQIARTVETEFDELFTAYPETVKSVRYVGVGGQQHPVTPLPEVELPVLGQTSWDLDGQRTVAVTINRQFPFAKLQERITNMDPSWSVMREVRDIISHEFGHVMHNYAASRLNIKDGDAALLNIYAIIKHELRQSGLIKVATLADPFSLRDEVARGISQYAGDKDSEMVAEAFADVWINGAKASKLSKAVTRILVNLVRSDDAGFKKLVFG